MKMNVVLTFVLFGLMSCKTSSINTETSGLQAKEQESAFDRSGTLSACASRDHNIACAAVIMPIDQEFLKLCEANGGKMVLCGECQNDQRCSVAVGKKAFTKTGQSEFCISRNVAQLCPAVATLLDQEFDGSCKAAGGKTMRCGPCQDLQRCTVSPVPIAYTKDGKSEACAPRAAVMCPTATTLLDQEFDRSCKAAGGKTVRCGPCQDLQRCSVGI